MRSIINRNLCRFLGDCNRPPLHTQKLSIVVKASASAAGGWRKRLSHFRSDNPLIGMNDVKQTIFAGVVII